MLGDAFEVRETASSVGFAGERPVPRRPHAGPSSWRSPASDCVLIYFSKNSYLPGGGGQTLRASKRKCSYFTGGGISRKE